MRWKALVALLVLAPFAAAEDVGVFKSEEYNFEIRRPRFSVDWEVQKITEADAKKGRRVHLRTVFADSNPPASAEVILRVTALQRTDARKSIDKVAKRWAPFIEAYLSNPRERTETAGKWGEVDHYRVDVKGDFEAGIHQLTWYIAKNGKSIYLLYINRSYRAVGDEDLDDEIKEIVASFKFLRVEKVEADRKAKKGAPEGVGADGGKAAKDVIDPELLKKETFKEPFWRFSCVKPKGLLTRKLTDVDKKRDTKFWFANDKQSCRLWLRIYAQTEKAKKFTIEQLYQHKLNYWKDEVKFKKEPKVDKNYKKYRMAKKAIRLDLLGRSATTIRRIYILMDCKNARQYQLEIFVSGTAGLKVWGKTIEEFLKNFKPFKK